MSSEQENNENEANVDLKGVIKDLADQIKILTKIVEAASKQTKANTTQSKDWHKYQAMMKIELEKEHGRQVRLNKEYGRTNESLQMFTGLLSRGVGVGLVFNKLAGAIGGVSKELDKYKAEHKELMRMEKEFAKKGINIGRGDLDLPSNDMQKAQWRRQQEAVDKAKEGKEGQGGKLAEGISSMKAFAEKHKTGILIGAGSAGILLAVLKKAFDVSPMFQAIKKLLQFGFMLILRPIGDFFGFIMRPIMVMMLRKFIIPWYKDVYPVMKKLGTWIGNQLVPTMEAIMTFISTPVGVATTVGVGAAGAAGVIAANLLMLKKLTTWLGIGGSKAASAGSGASSAVANLQKSVSSIRVRIVQLFKHPKMVISQITKNIGTKLNSITATVRSAIGGVRTALTTSASRITAFFTKGLNTATKNIGTKLSQMLPKITTAIKNVATTIGTKVGQFLPRITQGFSSLATSIGGLGKGVGDIFGKMGKSLGNVGKNFKFGNLLGKVGKGGGIVGIGMILEGLVASPETLGDLIPEDSKYRIDKLFNNAFGTGLSEDPEGNFKTIGYGDELMAMMGGDESYKHGIIAKLYGGEATGIGGGAGDTRSERGTTVVINVDHISNEMDLKHVADYTSESLAVENKRTAGT